MLTYSESNMKLMLSYIVCHKSDDKLQSEKTTANYLETYHPTYDRRCKTTLVSYLTRNRLA
jgi:hypothetical protein